MQPDKYMQVNHNVRACHDSRSQIIFTTRHRDAWLHLISHTHRQQTIHHTQCHQHQLCLQSLSHSNDRDNNQLVIGGLSQIQILLFVKSKVGLLDSFRTKPNEYFHEEYDVDEGNVTMLNYQLVADYFP